MPEKGVDAMKVTLQLERGDPMAKEWFDRFGKAVQVQALARRRFRDPFSPAIDAGLSGLVWMVERLVDAVANALTRWWRGRNAEAKQALP
jgi:hypothetical protein